MNKSVLCFLCGLTIIFTVTACGSDSPESSAPQTAVPSRTEIALTAPAQHPAAPLITGKVLEIIDSGGYTYLHLDTGDKKSWVALPPAKVNVGDEVSVTRIMVMSNFESKTLGRTFDEVIFSSGFGSASQLFCPGSFGKTLQSGNPVVPGISDQAVGSPKAIVPFTDLQVERAQGKNSYTVSELFEKKAALNGKTIVLRGKVIKVLQNIMGKNWIHLQDGTGNPLDNTHDLVITSSAVPEKESIITVTGLLTADKDFGAGYKYAVIVEDAQISE